jgi:hypothetical protein
MSDQPPRPAKVISPAVYLGRPRFSLGPLPGLVRSGARRQGTIATARRGMNVLLLQEILGHSSLTMIQTVYSHLDTDDAYKAAMKVLLGGSSLADGPFADRRAVP